MVNVATFDGKAELLDVEGLDLTQRLVWKRYTFTKDIYFVPDACTIQHVISKYQLFMLNLFLEKMT